MVITCISFVNVHKRLKSNSNITQGVIYSQVVSHKNKTFDIKLA